MGLFINTLPLRVDLNVNVHESVLRTHARLASLLEHEHASLVLAQRCSNVPQGTPLFSSVLNYRHNSSSSDAASIDPGIVFLQNNERTNYPLMLSVDDFGTELGLSVDVVQPLDPERICGYMQESLKSLAEALDHAPDTFVRELEVLPLGERRLLLDTWNPTQQDFPLHQCIHHFFEQQTERTPQATALVFKDMSLTYSELNLRSNRLAYHLIELGVRPDMRVAICVERSFAMIIGVLAILKAGGAYLPLDPNYPKERLAYILEDAAPTVALVDSMGTNPEVPALTSHHLSYVVYTSGSTGNPKGVMIEHRGVVNYVLARVEDSGLDASSQVLQFSSLNFDLSSIETFTAFFSGASLHLLEDHTRLDRNRLWDYMERQSITQAVLPPAILQECKGCPPLSTRLTLVSTAEELPASLLRALRPLVPNGAIINEYGPTETTLGSIAWRCPEQGFDGDMVPVGRPIANKRVYILDKNGQPVPLGAVGELYIGGVGVGRGYLNRPDLTAKAFLPDPFMEGTDAR
ncbi:hypothetical protein BGZ65_010181, partial [Modicella reniformis]